MHDQKDNRTVSDTIGHRPLDNPLYKMIVENSNDGIAIIQDTQIRYANPTLASMIGYAQEDLLNTSYTRYLPPESLEQVASFYQTLDRHAVPEIYETTVRHKDGHTIPIEINTSVISVNGRSADFIIFRSLKERRYRQRIAERMQQAQKLKSLGVLAGGISHDFNNLLQGILGNTDLALMYVSDLELVRICLRDIKQAASKASELAIKMLAYSGKGAFDIHETDLNRLLSETTELLDLAIPQNCRLEVVLAPELPKLKADQTQLSQAILNLLNNAVEAIGDSVGTITVSTLVCHCDRALLSETYLDEGLPEGTYVCLKVSDTGPGIAKGVEDKIFDPFFSTKFTGRGLGLAAVLGIVRAHNGAISVATGQGGGTTFNVFLPLSESYPIASQSSLSPTTMNATATILLVDDESLVRTTAIRILERFGYAVIAAPDGQSAIDIYAESGDRIHLVLLDMMMPRQDGKETFTGLKALDKDVRVILMSGFQEDEVRKRFTSPGPFDFLQKPFTARKLLSKVRRALNAQSHIPAPSNRF